MDDNGFSLWLKSHSIGHPDDVDSYVVDLFPFLPLPNSKALPLQVHYPVSFIQCSKVGMLRHRRSLVTNFVKTRWVVWVDV